MNKKKENKFPLWWIDPKSRKHYPAGMAFRIGNYGEYRLVIDCYPGRRLFLKDSKTKEKKIIFNLYEHVQMEDKFKKLIIGHAHSSTKTKGDIHIVIAPEFSSKLLLTF